MLRLIRRNKLFFLAFTLLGLLLRGYFLHWHFLFEGDSLVYGDLAKNWVLHGIYGITDDGSVMPVNIRMPGYPAFLAVSFRLFGLEHYAAVVRAQLVIDLLTCFLIAAGARRLRPDRAKIAFALAALCPFTANYAATPLPETLSIFAAAVALLFALRAIQTMRKASSWDVAHSFAIGDWCLSGIGIALSIYLRPDGGLLLVAIAAYLLWLGIHGTCGVIPRLLLCCSPPFLCCPWRRGHCEIGARCIRFSRLRRSMRKLQASTCRRASIVGQRLGC